ncbi:adenosylmethionine decarboxylase [Bradyrhizobium sp. USDA 3256]
MSLRVIACSAPQFVEGQAGEMALSSADPASLFNACRLAALMASRGHGAWGNSNWSGKRADRRRTTLLFSDREQMERELAPLLDEVRPNLFLIGAMSICFKGAIETAAFVREALGDDVCIVLGGRHATETIFLKGLEVQHHAASPLRLTCDGQIPDLFDVVLSGDAEHFIVGIGELVAKTAVKQHARSARTRLDELAALPGRWVAGTVTDGAIQCVRSTGVEIDYHQLPSPSAMFGIRGGFDVFDRVPTAHVFSDVGPGCIYDCSFCSERIGVVGAPQQLQSSGVRLHQQLLAARQVVDEDYSAETGVAAFVEDSTFLTWNPKLVRQFEELVCGSGVEVRLGGQATIDQIIRSPDIASTLRRTGLEYMFIGLETPLPDKIGGLHKDIGHKNASWMDRANTAVEILGDAGISVGVSLLFGLGEGMKERQLLFDALDRWKSAGLLSAISMNWAVQHPLRNTVLAKEYTYLDWAISPGPMLPLLRHFGEASERYPIAGGSIPQEAEVREIVGIISEIGSRDNTQSSRTEGYTMDIQEPKGGIHRLGNRISAGTHLFIDMWEAKNTGNAEAIEAAVNQAVKDANATLLDATYCKYSEDGGVTGFAILAESHICVNTWHDEKLIAIDVFFCGALDPYKCVPAFQNAFQPKRIDISEHKRLLGTPHTHPTLTEHLQ